MQINENVNFHWTEGEGLILALVRHNLSCHSSKSAYVWGVPFGEIKLKINRFRIENLLKIVEEYDV